MSELILFFTPEAIGHYLAEATAYAVVGRRLTYKDLKAVA